MVSGRVKMYSDGLSDRVFRCSGSHYIHRDMSLGVVPADVAMVVAADAASVIDDGTLSLHDQDGTLSPTDIAGILFPADCRNIEAGYCNELLS